MFSWRREATVQCEMGSGSENSVERKSKVLRRESNQVNASLNNCEDVQMGQRVVNKIDLNIFCAKENNETRDMSPSVVTGADNNINVTLPRDVDKAAEAEADFRLKLCGRTFCGRAERCFLLKLMVFLCCVCLFVTLLYVFTRPPGKNSPTVKRFFNYFIWWVLARQRVSLVYIPPLQYSTLYFLF